MIRLAKAAGSFTLLPSAITGSASSPLARHADVHLGPHARARELQGVSDQVLEELLEAQLVARHHQRAFVAGQHQGVNRESGLDLVDCATQQCAQVQGF